MGKENVMNDKNKPCDEELLESLYEDKWLNLNECGALTGLSRRLLKERCKKRLIEHQNYGGRDAYRIQWRNLKSYMDSHKVSRDE